MFVPAGTDARVQRRRTARGQRARMCERDLLAPSNGAAGISSFENANRQAPERGFAREEGRTRCFAGEREQQDAERV